MTLKEFAKVACIKQTVVIKEPTGGNGMLNLLRCIPGSSLKDSDLKSLHNRGIKIICDHYDDQGHNENYLEIILERACEN